MKCRMPPKEPFHGYLVQPAPTAAEPSAPPVESCDYCGATTLTWRKCKLICDNCAQINKSCADL